jgi:hypothetical protein
MLFELRLGMYHILFNHSSKPILPASIRHSRNWRSGVARLHYPKYVKRPTVRLSGQLLWGNTEMVMRWIGAR